MPRRKRLYILKRGIDLTRDELWLRHFLLTAVKLGLSHEEGYVGARKKAVLELGRNKCLNHEKSCYGVSKRAVLEKGRELFWDCKEL